MVLEELSGASVVIFDDTEREVKSIEKALEERDISFEFIKVDLNGEGQNHDIVKAIKLVFLDLSYSTNFSSTFNPSFCAKLIHDVVPVGKQYYLVVWTKDPDNTEAVIELLREDNIMPVSYVSKRKEDYRLKDDIYDAERLFSDLEKAFEEIQSVEDFYGEIVEVEEDAILINCLLDTKRRVSQIRRFDKMPFTNYVDMQVGNYVLIRTVTKPGSRLWEFSNVTSDLSDLFKKEDYFEGLENTSFFKAKKPSDESNI